eukprot:Lithocolla_globosa_v1_NODE_8614_length_800_cov_3.930201.p2 type:complete len:112 gc:universal NODE_8614_length_800_cov_3.930201:441-776(+)
MLSKLSFLRWYSRAVMSFASFAWCNCSSSWDMAELMAANWRLIEALSFVVETFNCRWCRSSKMSPVASSHSLPTCPNWSTLQHFNIEIMVNFPWEHCSFRKKFGLVFILKT